MKRVGILLLFAAVAHAQSASPTPAAELAAELASADAVRVAKAAAAARTHAAKELDRALVAALLDWTKRNDEHAVFARLFVLDALIARRARVPGDALAPLLDEPECSNAAFVLLCQSPRQNEQVLLQRFLTHEAVDLQRQAIGNLLAANRTPGFAARIWDNAQMRPILLVADASSGRRSLRIAPSFAPEPESGPAGLPPIPHFTLCDRTGDDVALLALGQTPVFYRRTVGDETAPSSYTTSRVPYTMELEWLETMAGSREPVETDARIQFPTPEAYVADATSARDRLLSQRRALLRSLVEHGVMTATEAAACDVTSVQILDGRQGVNKALPTLPPLLPSIEELLAGLTRDDARSVARAADAVRTAATDAMDRGVDRALVAALAEWSKRGGTEAAAVRLFVLDAMIARGIEAPGDLLAPMLDDSTTRGAAFVLVCRAPKANERLLLARYRQVCDAADRRGADAEEWRIAIGNLLAANRAPGFAAVLWEAPEARPRIVVGMLQPAGFDLVGLGFGGRAAIAVPAGFPPVPYHLAQCGTRDAAELRIPGPVDIAFVRTTEAAMAGQIRLPHIAEPPVELRWLESLAGLLPGDAMQAQVAYTKPDVWLAEATAARDRLLARRRELHAALARHGAFNAEELMRCKVGDVEVVDARPDKTKPLPALPAPGN